MVLPNAESGFFQPFIDFVRDEDGPVMTARATE
jgi:hypothetical protein